MFLNVQMFNFFNSELDTSPFLTHQSYIVNFIFSHTDGNCEKEIEKVVISQFTQ